MKPRNIVPTVLRVSAVLVLLLSGAVAPIGGVGSVEAQEYTPPRGDWERKPPAEMGFDAALLERAIAFAIAAESQGNEDLAASQSMERGREPLDRAVGPMRPRGPMTGMIVKDGYVIAEWGDVRRVDMTFSVAKSFLSTTVGLAWEDGLIRDVHDPVADYMAPIVLPPGDGEPGHVSADVGGAMSPVELFVTEHNRKITWDHLLRQTSDWEGTLWGKPDWADRPGPDLRQNRDRERDEPGSVYKYNDTRVNLLALAALQVWRRPLPEVLRDRIMDPIGASNRWRWTGYENSWVAMDGLMIQSVSGGGHWGGGMFISAEDQARFGLLTLRRGRWGDRQLLSEDWYRMAETPGPANPAYGFMNWFLNTGGAQVPGAPESSFVHRGAGSNLIYVDRENDLVVVARWIQGGEFPEFIRLVLSAMDGS